MTYGSIDEAVAELKKHPGKTVRAHCGDLDVELRAVARSEPSRRLGDSLASLGPWEGESMEELIARLRDAREAGGSAEPPVL